MELSSLWPNPGAHTVKHCPLDPENSVAVNLLCFTHLCKNSSLLSQEVGGDCPGVFSYLPAGIPFLDLADPEPHRVEINLLYHRSRASCVLLQWLASDTIVCNMSFLLLLVGKVIKHGDIKSIVNEGMPTYKSPFVKGQLIIQFSVKFPEDGFLDAKRIQVRIAIHLFRGGGPVIVCSF